MPLDFYDKQKKWLNLAPKILPLARNFYMLGANGYQGKILILCPVFTNTIIGIVLFNSGLNDNNLVANNDLSC